MNDEYKDEVSETLDNNAKNLKNNTEKRIIKTNIIAKERGRNTYVIENKVGFAKCVGSVIWLIANAIMVAFFATYSHSIVDLFIAISLPLNMIVIVMSFNGSYLDYSDEFIK